MKTKMVKQLLIRWLLWIKNCETNFDVIIQESWFHLLFKSYFFFFLIQSIFVHIFKAFFFFGSSRLSFFQVDIFSFQGGHFDTLHVVLHVDCSLTLGINFIIFFKLVSVDQSGFARQISNVSEGQVCRQASKEASRNHISWVMLVVRHSGQADEKGCGQQSKLDERSQGLGNQEDEGRQASSSLGPNELLFGFQVDKSGSKVEGQENRTVEGKR